MKRLVLATIRVILLGGCATTACLINRGHVVTYNTNGGGVEVRSKTEPCQPVEVIARDLKACNDESGLGYVGRLQFRKCMDPRGYAVTSRD